MRGVSGFFAGIAGLSLLYVAIKSNAQGTAAIISVPLNMLARWISPYVPLIPDNRPPN